MTHSDVSTLVALACAQRIELVDLKLVRCTMSDFIAKHWMDQLVAFRKNPQKTIDRETRRFLSAIFSMAGVPMYPNETVHHSIAP